MAFGEQNEISKLPTDFNIGQIEGVQNLRDSKNNPLNQVMDVKIKPFPSMASRNQKGGETFYLTVRDSWFGSRHTRKDLTKEGGEIFLYDNFFGRKGSKQKGSLQQLLTDAQVSELGSLVATGGVNSAAQFADFLNDRIANKVVGYILKQAMERTKVTDPDTGEERNEKYRSEYKNVSGFFGPEDVEGLNKAAEKAKEQAEREHDKTGEKTLPTMRVFWDARVEPFEAAVEQLVG